MIFLCFSSKDRIEIVESIYYHLTNIGLPVWYDRQEILMGQNRKYKNFIEGVESCDYAVIVLSPNSIDSIYANEEIDLIYERFKNNEMYVIPVFFNIVAEQIPEKYGWMKKLVYKELNIDNSSRSLCNHICCKYLLDIIDKSCKYKSISEISRVTTGYIKELINSYQKIDGLNFNARISILYSVIIFLQNNKQLPNYILKGTYYLFDETKLNLKMDLRETIIMERLCIISINYFLQSLK